MNLSEEEEIKKEFQLERVILFSDAVFAIIITIMVIDLKLPETIKNANADQWREAFMELVPKFLAYVISFVLVARFWMEHLKIFSYLKDYNRTLLVLNLLFLFANSLFPFAASILAGIGTLKSFNTQVALDIYIAIIFSIILTQTLLIGYLIRNKETLCFFRADMETDLKWKVQRINLICIPVIFGVIVAMSYFDLKPMYATYPAFAYALIIAQATKRYYPKKSIARQMLTKAMSRRKKIVKAKE